MKQIAKSTARGICIVLVLPVYGWFLVGQTLSTANASLETCSQFMSLFPGRFGDYLRNAFYRLTLEQCDKEATICFGVLISDTRTRLGRHAYVGPRCNLGWVILEEDVLLGPSVNIPSGPSIHTFESLDQPVRNQPRRPCQITVGHDCWIGTNAVVLADVGAKSVVGANSTVTRPIVAKTIAVGSPAKPIGTRGTPDE